jgi:hypothetical protein
MPDTKYKKALRTGDLTGPGLPTTRREPRPESGPRDGPAIDIYFSELLIEVKLVFMVPPSKLTVAIIASEMPAAIRPYSIAVAPDSSDQNLDK